MRGTLFLILLAAQLVITGCGGPSFQARKLWNEACNANAGTHITESISDVGSFIYKGVSRQRIETFRRKEDAVFATLPVISSYDFKDGYSYFATAPIFPLFDARNHYASFEITVPSDGYYDSSLRRIDFSEGHYRISIERRGYPNCMSFGGYAGIKETEHVAANRCLVATPIPKLTARFKVTHSIDRWRDETSDVESETYVVTDTRTGNAIARHTRHTLSWTEPTLLGLPEWKSQPCPLEETAFDIRAVLKPGDTE